MTSLGIISVVLASTSWPMVAPRLRSQAGVAKLEYNGNNQVRASSSTRIVDQACHEMRDCTG